ncbi:SDR family NAD(P)-dependent oxidoreductase, partial [Streptomyces niveus]
MSDQVWFITGASRGLGRAVAEEALAAGNRVVATARRPEAFADLAEKHGDRLLALRLVVTDPEQARATVEA